jgi:L-fuculose-phosphate aldolase
MDIAAVEEMRIKLARLGKLLFDRFLTDSAGGNMSARVGDVVCFSPRYAGGKFQWHLRPNQVLVVDLAGNKLYGDGELSRESKVHLRLYKDFPMGGAVIHAHPRNVLVFCAYAKPIPAIMEDTWKFGEIKVAPFAPAHGSMLADNISATLAGQEERINRQAAAVIAPFHGLFAIGKDLDSTFDAVERIDTNARIVLMGQSIDQAVLIAQKRQAEMDAAMIAFDKK